jgi:peptide-methionine (S)-S-oxide reductase
MRVFPTVLLVAGSLAVAMLMAGLGHAGMSQKNQRSEELSKRGNYLVPGVVEPVVTEVATFAAGCFWGVEDVFRHEPGVVATAVGYTGGKTTSPTYKQVCYDNTGHAEAVQVEFDPRQTSYTKLLVLFLDIHDPTTLNRQGPDVGDQYRSAVFFHGAAQEAAARAELKRLGASGELDRPVVTAVVAAPVFWPAEGYHQQYVEKGGRASCHRRSKH